MGENLCARSCRCNPGVVLSTFVSPWEFEEDFWSVIGTSPTPIGTTKDMIRGTANVCLVSLNCSGVIPYYYQDFIDDFLDYAAGQRSCPMPPQYAWHCLATFMYVPPLHTILTLGVECAKTTERPLKPVPIITTTHKGEIMILPTVSPEELKAALPLFQSGLKHTGPKPEMSLALKIRCAVANEILFGAGELNDRIYKFVANSPIEVAGLSEQAL